MIVCKRGLPIAIALSRDATRAFIKVACSSLNPSPFRFCPQIRSSTWRMLATKKVFPLVVTRNAPESSEGQVYTPLSEELFQQVFYTPRNSSSKKYAL
jgi:hypothetical protein